MKGEKRRGRGKGEEGVPHLQMGLCVIVAWGDARGRDMGRGGSEAQHPALQQDDVHRTRDDRPGVEIGTISPSVSLGLVVSREGNRLRLVSEISQLVQCLIRQGKVVSPG
jgi:hypothetical protein